MPISITLCVLHYQLLFQTRFLGFFLILSNHIFKLHNYLIIDYIIIIIIFLSIIQTRLYIKPGIIPLLFLVELVLIEESWMIKRPMSGLGT